MDLLNRMLCSDPDKRILTKEVTAIRSFDHKIYTCTTKKVVLTGYYDKMQMIDSVDCVPFGYKKKH
jgi:hypothetical protein